MLRSNTEEDRKILYTALEREYCIEEAGSTGEALQIMYRKAVAVFLCDEDMPGYAEVLEQMYRDKELSLIPVFATKPIKMRVLRVQIQNALEYRWIFFIIWCILLVGGGGIYAEPAGSKRCGIELGFQWRGSQ